MNRRHSGNSSWRYPADRTTRSRITDYGAALVRAGRAAEGAAELQTALNLEPYYADPYFWLGEARLAQSDSSGARQAFQDYATRAAANAPQLGIARQRITALARPREE
jgi:TolA-binding protein